MDYEFNEFCRRNFPNPKGTSERPFLNIRASDAAKLLEMFGGDPDEIMFLRTKGNNMLCYAGVAAAKMEKLLKRLPRVGCRSRALSVSTILHMISTASASRAGNFEQSNSLQRLRAKVSAKIGGHDLSGEAESNKGSDS